MRNLFTFLFLPILIFILSVLVAVGLVSANPQTNTMDRFTKISVSGSANVYIQKGNKHNIEIIAEEQIIDKIKTEIKDGELFIKTDKMKIFRKNKHKVIVTVPILERIAVSGAGDLFTEGHFQGQDLELIVSGAGTLNFAGSFQKINAKINGAGDLCFGGEATDLILTVSGAGTAKFNGNFQNTDVSISGAGDIIFKGKGDFITGVISGSGDLHAFKMPVSNARLKVSGAGDAYIHAANEVMAQVSGAGEVQVKGKAKLIKTK
ncbi:MAG: DUF2807 domain-containing protein [Bernardetiaceae bacterium]|nr:DUF2807 domain-containing protein [Bernardetiaceae bacterium]